MSSPKNINMKSPISTQSPLYQARLHIITPPHKRVIVPKHQTRSAIPNNKPRDVSRQWVITIHTGPVRQGTDGCWSHTKQWVERVRETSPTQTATCSPLPNPSPCDRTLGPRTPGPHLTETTSLSVLPTYAVQVHL